MSIGERIKWLRKTKCDLTMEDVGKKLGVNKATIQKYENGVITTIPSDKVEKMAELFETTPGFIMGWDIEPDYPGDSDIDRAIFRLEKLKDTLYRTKNVVSLNGVLPHRIPLVGSAAAGEPVYNEEVDVYVNGPLKADCAIRVQGDSMNPTYIDGDILYIRSQPDIDYEGQIAVAVVGDEACVKHVYRQQEGLLLTSDNPAYAPMFKRYSDYDNNIRVIGRVVGFTRMYKE